MGNKIPQFHLIVRKLGTAFLAFFFFMNLSAQPVWYESATIYQIYPLSFQDSDGDGTGDIKGIISRLDYLKNLGIGAIWLSPVYPSPWADHGYDISDYKAIHPRMGTLADFDSLVREADKRGIYLIMDLVMNHTSDEHEWFRRAINDSSGGKFRNMYVWKEGRKRPNNWKGMTGGSGWHFHPEAKAWYWASFLKFQPDLNYGQQAVTDSIFSVMDFWTKRGVKGFRLDIFNCLAEDSEFRNNPFSFRAIPSEGNPDGFYQKVRYTQNTDETFRIAEKFRYRLDSLTGREGFSVGEVFGSADVLKKYVGEGKGLHSVFLFKSLHNGFKPKKWLHFIRENELHFPGPFHPTLVLSNHDKKRFISRLKNKEDKMRCIAFLQFTLRGIPFVYQGEEIGMLQQRLNPKTAQDPIVKKFGTAATRLARISGESMNRDECRTPVSWNSETNGGFSTGDRIWLAPAKEYKQINAEKAMQDPHSLFHYYRKLILLKKHNPVLAYGRLELPSLKNRILSFMRVSEGKSYTALVNFGKRAKRLDLNENAKVIFGELTRNKKGKVTIPGRTAVLISDY